jgi:hypothetical protein
MNRRTRVVASTTATIASVLLLGAAMAVGSLLITLEAAAQPQPMVIDDATLDQIRAQIPEGEPGEYDLTEASAEFGQLVSLFGQSTVVADFGVGSELTGLCGGFAYSYDKNGDLLDAAFDVGDDNPPVDLLDGTQAFTASNRFRVDPRGVVVYYGFAPESGDGPLNHSWYIKTSGISLDKGGDPNTLLKNRNAGIVDLDNDLPVKFTANIEVEAHMRSDNQPDCFGVGHVSVEGDGLTDPVGIAGLALLGGGVFGLLFNARPAMTWKSP